MENSPYDKKLAIEALFLSFDSLTKEQQGTKLVSTVVARGYVACRGCRLLSKPSNNNR